MNDEETILELERVGYAAIENGDGVRLGELSAPTFTGTLADGTVLTKEEWVSTMLTNSAMGISLRPQEASVRIEGDRAVVTRILDIVKFDAGASSARRSVVCASVYEKHGGRWCVAL